MRNRAVALLVACSRVFRKRPGATGPECTVCGVPVEEARCMFHVMSRHPAIWTNILLQGGS